MHNKAGYGDYAIFDTIRSAISAHMIEPSHEISAEHGRSPLSIWSRCAQHPSGRKRRLPASLFPFRGLRAGAGIASVWTP